MKLPTVARRTKEIKKFRGRRFVQFTHEGMPVCGLQPQVVNSIDSWNLSIYIHFSKYFFIQEILYEEGFEQNSRGFTKTNSVCWV